MTLAPERGFRRDPLWSPKRLHGRTRPSCFTPQIQTAAVRSIDYQPKTADEPGRNDAPSGSRFSARAGVKRQAEAEDDSLPKGEIGWQRPHAIGRSDEADARGLELGRQEGEALGPTLRYMIEEVADTGEEIESGDYLIGFAAEKAEGMYVPRDGRLERHEPEDENVHLEVAVRDRADGCLIPGLDGRATVTDEDGQEIGTHEHSLLWHPYLYHYGQTGVFPEPAAIRFGSASRPRALLATTARTAVV